MKRTLIIVAAVVSLASCKTIPAPKVPAPAVAAIDCALPSLWAAVDPSTVSTAVQSGIAQKDPLAALAVLADMFGETEVTCVVARENSVVKMATRAEFDGGIPKPVTQQWLDAEAAKGLYVKNFAALQ